MRRVHILVEGQTEETFVRDLLAPHLLQREIILNPVLVTTKRTKSGIEFKGGISTYTRVRKDVIRLLGDSSAVAVTTMIDYYGLPRDFPGYASRPASSCYDRVQHLQQAFSVDINDDRFIPFITLHEFEALLFSDTGLIATAFPGRNIVRSLTSIKQQFNSPEEINEGSNTHPAARITQHVAEYQKPYHGILIAKQIGLVRIRNECSHFGNWLSTLESLA